MLSAEPTGALAGEDLPFSGRDAGHFEIPEPCATGLQVVIGGLGVAGELHVLGLANLATGEYSQVLTGTISHHGS